MNIEDLKKLEKDQLWYIDYDIKNERIFIIPNGTNKPVKIIYEEYSCPIDQNIRCKYSEFIKTEDLILSIKCKNSINNCNKFYLMDMEIK
jgi:hypothetical protein